MTRWLPVRRLLLAVLALAIVALSACRLDPPLPGQTLAPNPYPLDRTPAPADMDIPYGPDAHQRLDAYPAIGAASGVAIVYAHGGGWAFGDKDETTWRPVAQYLMDRGHVVFSIDYTLGTCTSGGAPYPDNLNDVKWAIAWANQAAQKTQYNYSKVVVMGHSAGGHLASLASVTSESRPPDMPTTGDYNVRPDGAIAISAPQDMVTYGKQGTPADQDWQSGGLFFGVNLVQCFWGSQYLDPNDVPLVDRQNASPPTFVDPNDPPMLFTGGADDSLALAAYNADVLEAHFTAISAKFDYWGWNDRIDSDEHGVAIDYLSHRAALDLYLAMISQGIF
ncbi:MAG: alpha/beta hydrolase [Halioglobus sp.]|nr:alpha/beta hydrolase [Halioglobus sp.]